MAGGGKKSEDRAVRGQALRLAGFGDAHGVGGQQLQERVGGVGLFGQGEQALLEFREFLLGLAGGVAAIQIQQRDHQAKCDGDGDGKKQKNARPQQAGRREGVTVDDPDQQDRDHQGRDGDQRSAFRNRQETQALFQPLKVTIQLVESVHATSFSTERYRLANTDSIIAIIKTSSKA